MGGGGGGREVGCLALIIRSGFTHGSLVVSSVIPELSFLFSGTE